MDLDGCQTLLLDMDGTLLDLAYDTDIWLRVVPEAYARRHAVSLEAARERLYAEYRQFEGTLDWYCLDRWSERLGLDVLALHRERSSLVAYLPGAKEFLERTAAASMRVVLVTNSHQETLAIKVQQTGLDVYFDGIHSAHDIGHAKEEQAFWSVLSGTERLDADRTVFVDDTPAVLASAEKFGLRRLVQVTRPDSSRPVKPATRFSPVGAVSELQL